MDRTRITITGRLTRQPELRVAGTGRTWTEFDVAVNRRRRNDNGDWEDGTPTFHTVRATDALATNLATLDKGSPVLIFGELITDEWNDKNTGERRTKAKVLAEAAGLDYSRARLTENAESGGHAPSAESATDIEN